MGSTLLRDPQVNSNTLICSTWDATDSSLWISYSAYRPWTQSLPVLFQARCNWYSWYGHGHTTFCARRYFLQLIYNLNCSFCTASIKRTPLARWLHPHLVRYDHVLTLIPYPRGGKGVWWLWAINFLGLAGSGHVHRYWCTWHDEAQIWLFSKAA